MQYFIVVIGGGAGALSRYLSIQFINAIFRVKFAFGTLAVNCIGAFFIGLLVMLFTRHSWNEKIRLLLITGFLGGYTTFSSYSLETIQYFLDGHIKHGLLNMALNNGLCLFFVMCGMYLGMKGKFI